MLFATLKTPAIAILLAASLGVNGGTALALSPEKAKMEAQCKEWTTVNQSDNEVIIVARGGKDVELHCQQGFFAALQECEGDKKLKRFRCEQSRPNL